MKNMELDYSTWRVGLKMAWRNRLGRLGRSDGINGDRAVRADRRLRAGGQNGSATVGSRGLKSGGKRLMASITSVLQGH